MSPRATERQDFSFLKILLTCDILTGIRWTLPQGVPKHFESHLRSILGDRGRESYKQFGSCSQTHFELFYSLYKDFGAKMSLRATERQGFNFFEKFSSCDILTGIRRVLPQGIQKHFRSHLRSILGDLCHESYKQFGSYSQDHFEVFYSLYKDKDFVPK